VKGFIVTRFAD